VHAHRADAADIVLAVDDVRLERRPLFFVGSALDVRTTGTPTGAGRWRIWKWSSALPL
jgi:hypothetical protein